MKNGLLPKFAWTYTILCFIFLSYCRMIYMGLEIGLDVLEKFWKGFGNSLIKMCGNPDWRKCKHA